MVCDIFTKNEEPENWLMTEFINIKDAAARLDVEVTYTLRDCPLANVGPFCRTNFSLYSYHTDYKLNPDPKPLNYHKETRLRKTTKSYLACALVMGSGTLQIT